MSNLRKKIEDAINRICRENVSNTPDFVLAKYLESCLQAFEAATAERDKWYSVHLEPANSHFNNSLPICGASSKEEAIEAWNKWVLNNDVDKFQICPSCDGGIIRSSFGEPDIECSQCKGSGKIHHT